MGAARLLIVRRAKKRADQLGMWSRVGDYSVRESVFAVGLTVVQIAAGNPSRVFIQFAPPATGSSAVVSTKSTVTSGTGMVIPTASLQSYDWTTSGPLAGLPWYAISAGAGQTVIVLEVLFQPKS